MSSSAAPFTSRAAMGSAATRGNRRDRRSCSMPSGRKRMTNAGPAQNQPREVKIRVHDGVEIAVALYMPEGEGQFPGPAGAVAVSLRQQRAAGDAAVSLARDRADRVLPEARLRLCPHGRARLRQVGRRVPPARPQRAEGPLRCHRMARPRSRGRTARSAASANPISACRNGGWRSRSRRRSPASPPSTGSTIPTAPRSIRAAFWAISSAAIGGTRTASSIAIRPTASIRASSPAI